MEILDRIDVAVAKHGGFLYETAKSKWMPLFSAAVVVAMFATQPVRAELLEKTKKVGGTTVSL